MLEILFPHFYTTPHYSDTSLQTQTVLSLSTSLEFDCIIIIGANPQIWETAKYEPSKCKATFYILSWIRNNKLHLSFSLVSLCLTTFTNKYIYVINPLKPELNPICYLLALLAHHFLHVSRIRIKSLTFRLLMPYKYMEHPFLMFLDHTQRRSTVGRTPLDE